MSSGKDDPLLSLRRRDDPEPDPIRMEQTIRQSTAAFAEAMREAPARRAAPDWWERLGSLFSSSGWLVPAGVGMFAIVIGISILPQMMPQHSADMAPSAVPSPARAPAPEAEMAEAPADAADQAIRLGAAPQSVGRSLDADLVAPLERFTFGDLTLGLRNTPESYVMYMLDGNIETPFDARVKQPGETALITDAFRLDPAPDGSTLLLVRSGIEGAQQWEAFVADGGRYALSGRLTQLIYNAESRDEVVERLAGAG